MKETKTLDRREFTSATVMALLSGVAVTVSACGGSSSSPAPSTPSTPAPTPTPGGAADVTGSIGSNHGHTAVITGAELDAGAQVSLDIQGDSSHPHTVILSADQVQAIAAGQRVQEESSNDAAHSHTVTFN